ALVFCVVVLALASSDRVSRAKLTKAWSARTYAIYLLHPLCLYPMLDGLSPTLGTDLTLVLALLLLAAVTEIAHRFFEAPINRWVRARETRADAPPRFPARWRGAGHGAGPGRAARHPAAAPGRRRPPSCPPGPPRWPHPARRALPTRPTRPVRTLRTTRQAWAGRTGGRRTDRSPPRRRRPPTRTASAPRPRPRRTTEPPSAGTHRRAAPPRRSTRTANPPRSANTPCRTASVCAR